MSLYDFVSDAIAPDRWQRSDRIFVGVVLLLFSWVLTGCIKGDYRPEAVGQEGAITVVIDSMRWRSEVGEALRNELGSFIQTLPAPEIEFLLQPTNLTGDNFEAIKQYKNIVFVAPLSDSSDVSKFLRARLGEGTEEALQRSGGVVVPKENLWRRKQMVVYMTAANAEDLVDVIRNKGEDLRYLFNNVTRQRVRDEMFEKGRQSEVEEYLMENHGFTFNVQHDFFVAIDTTNFVWLRRVLSDTERNLFVYYVENGDPSVLTPEWIYATRDSIAQQFIQGSLGDFMMTDYRRPLDTESLNFLGRYGFETRGLWYMVHRNEAGEIEQRHAMGGPFVNYTFYDETSGRIYMIDGMVFAPGFDKREFLRQMEVIAHTFRTRAELQAKGQVAALAK